MVKKVLLIIMAVIMVCSMFLFAGCSKKASSFSEEEHVQRVTERIHARYIDGDEKLRPYDKPTDDGEIYPKVKVTDFKVYPLYDNNDDLKYFLVEFQPFGYLYVLLRNEQLKAFTWLGASTSMYMLSSIGGEPAWTPYTKDIGSKDEIWQLDDNGEKIIYYNSPFKIASVENKKKYLLQTESQSARPDEHHKTSYCIPAAKTEKGFLNLISNSTFDNSNILFENLHATQYITFTNKKHFDL